MKLIVSELINNNLYQTIKPSETTHVEAIRPKLYYHNNPTGEIRLQLLDNNGELIAESSYLDMATITSAQYFHGYVRFYINASLSANVNYRIRLKTRYHTPSETSYIGWCHEYDNIKNTPTYTVGGTFSNPLDLEVWQRHI